MAYLGRGSPQTPHRRARRENAGMTIASTTVANSGSSTNGATTQFSFAFHIADYGDVEAEDQIVVRLVTTATGAETVLTRGTSAGQYSVSINADQTASPGGSITTISTYASGYKIWIELSPSFLQATDYQNQGAFFAETVEDQADQQARQILVLKDRQRRTPYVGVPAGASFDGEIAGPYTAGYGLVVNGSGTGFTLSASLAAGAVSSAWQAVINTASIALGWAAAGFSSVSKTLNEQTTQALMRTTGLGVTTVADTLITQTTQPLMRTTGLGVDIQGYLFGLTLSNNGSDATNDIDIAAGQAADATGAVRMALAASLTKRLDAAWAVGAGNGGLDTGSIDNTTYHVWLIMRSDTGVVDALFSTSASSPTMPANYDYKRRIGSILRESSAIVGFVQNGDKFTRKAIANDINAANPGTAAVSRALSVPAGISVEAIISVSIADSTPVGSVYVLLSDLATTDAVAGVTNANFGVNSGAAITLQSSLTIRTSTAREIRSRLSSSDASVALRLNTIGWIDTRGRLA